LNGSLRRVYTCVCLLGVTLNLSGCIGAFFSKKMLQPEQPNGLSMTSEYNKSILGPGFVEAYNQYLNNVCIEKFGDNPSTAATLQPTGGTSSLPEKSKNTTANISLAVKADNQRTCNHSPDQNKILRNRMIEAIRFEIDESYGNFTSTLHVNRAGTNVLFDMASLGLTTAATVTGDKEVAGMLTAAATGTLGTKTSLDKNFFDDQARQAIIGQMDASRSTVGNEIENGEQKALADYTLEKALTDLRRYYQAGTLVSSLQAIGAQAGSTKVNSDVQRGVIRKDVPLTNPIFPFTPPATAKQPDPPHSPGS
jgi:hypothetical protein